MEENQRHELQRLALSLTNIAKAAESNPELRRLLDNVAMVNGDDIDHWAKCARKLSNAYPYDAADDFTDYGPDHQAREVVGLQYSEGV